MGRFRGLMIACTALVLVAACADAPTGPEGGGPPPDGLTITVGQVAEPLSLDPHAVIDQPSARAIRQVYDTLVDQTDTLELVPGLAERWTQVDDVTWEFEIRPGVSFHDGSLLTGSDVVFTLERLRDPTTFAPVSFLLASVDEIELVDAMTVRITTVQPFVPLLTNLAQTATSILSESALTAAGDAYGTTVVVGTGPFRFASWEAGSDIVLERNDTWWGGDVGPERLVMRSIPDAGLRAAEIEDGAIDVAYALATSDAVRFRDDTAITLAEIETLNTAYIGFNAQKAPFDDVRVRQAINHAIDVDVIIDEVYQGAGVRASSPIGPQVFGAHPDLEPYAHDKVLALDLLAEAGLADGFSATLWTNLNPIRIQIADIVADQLAEVGIDIEVQVLEWSTYLNDTAAGEHDMFILAWTTANADADYGLYSLFHSSAFGHAGNRSFWSNARVDELLDLGRTTADPDARRDHYHEAQEIIADEAPWIFLNTTIESNATRADVTGFVPHPTGHHRLFGLDKE